KMQKAGISEGCQAFDDTLGVLETVVGTGDSASGQGAAVGGDLVALCQGRLVSGGAERHEPGRHVDGGKHDADADGQVLEAVARAATLSAVPRQVREDDE